MTKSKPKKTLVTNDVNRVIIMVAVVAALSLVVFAGIGSLYGG